MTKLCSKNDSPDYYRPQRSCGQGNVFTSVCLSTGGCLPQCMLGYPPRPGRHPPWTRQTPRTRHTTTPPPSPGPGRPLPDPLPGTGRPPPREADSSRRSMSGRYASYWNAFLFVCLIFRLSVRRTARMLEEDHMRQEEYRRRLQEEQLRYAEM